ncbi:hypothetical protein SSBR45G_12960 [Bradyrhizobium sp. SSBR45G]|uniref:DUF6869 domain-containing protein n=1 Tax=unclassified Bradyrhizobium TaxID=2631580 RepID=UPI002342AFCA|nr:MULTISPECIES: hypothetical protein [unclassified Bradyrhizobium]GLH76388.1 hypothetical protein SSBR45G_12960 [Bradyrhizobium sp. SSBR45G]GLH83128.1 hypothetical protein SSBR45R_05880 [Bradyrhizobium sp. SSBR45R]
MTNRHDLARAWIDYHRLPQREANAHPLFSAWETLDALVRDQPEAAWPIIRDLWALDPSDRMLALIAAGPVEDLLCQHGADFIGRIEQLARQEPVVRKMLGAVWGQSRMADDVWRRLKAVAGPSF